MPLDARLGVPGLPQSGTGQTALFTGINAARIVGKHFGPFPYSTLRPVIAEQNLLTQLARRGFRPCFANAFPDRFFRYMEKHEARLTVTTRSSLDAGLPLRTAADLRAGRGISADITGEGWGALGHPDIVPVTPAEAGGRLVKLLQHDDLVLFEYWHTDRAGHARDMEQSVAAIERFDRMLAGILGAIDFRSTLLVLTSDHGNMEDLSVKTHTRNSVPLVLAGLHHARVAANIGGRAHPDLTLVTPALLRLFD
jgi:2,3-bisphosphoglycerate-independent phosphoglycerate mutase